MTKNSDIYGEEIETAAQKKTREKKEREDYLRNHIEYSKKKDKILKQISKLNKKLKSINKQIDLYESLLLTGYYN